MRLIVMQVALGEAREEAIRNMDSFPQIKLPLVPWWPLCSDVKPRGKDLPFSPLASIYLLISYHPLIPHSPSVGSRKPLATCQKEMLISGLVPPVVMHGRPIVGDSIACFALTGSSPLAALLCV